MNATLTAHSPVHHLVEALGPHWTRIGAMPTAAHFGSPQEEAAAVRTLGLCDLSALVKLGVKGPQADAWLAQQGVDVPGDIYETRRLSDGGLAVKIAADEYVLESGPACRTVPELLQKADDAALPAGVYRVEQQTATFLVGGTGALAAMAQTCGVNLAEAVPERLIYSRVAGVSCAILPETLNAIGIYRLWVDYCDAIYLWQTLTQIIGELGGRVVGAACLYPDLPVQ